MADISQNSSFNQSSEYGNVYRPQTVFSVLTFTLLAMLVVATFFWNMLVLVTILRVRTFHRVPHNLVASMAISDVMVAALVMPLSLVHELNGRRWKLGRVLCQVWISFDVLCLYSQHLERDRNSPRPLLVHNSPPGVHAEDPKEDLQCDDWFDLAAVVCYFPLPSVWLGWDVFRGGHGVPGEPGAVLHHLFHIRGLLSASLCCAVCLLEDIQSC